MIKLDDLKKDDIVYRICKYHWMIKYKVVKEKHMFMRINKESHDSVTLKSLDGIFKGNKDEVFLSDENNLFRTRQEAKDSMKEYRHLEKEYLLEGDNFLTTLYYDAIGSGSVPEETKKIYREVFERKMKNGRA